MKEKYKNNIINLIIIIFFIYVLLNRQILNKIVLLSAKLFFINVFPYVFIMIILEELLVNYNFLYYIHRIFKIQSVNIIILFLSMICGSPTNAIIITNFFNKGLITQNDANQLLKCTFFANPLFLYNILQLIFNNNFISISIIIIHYVTNIIIFVFSLQSKNPIKKLYFPPSAFGSIISKSINKSVNTCLMIFGSITLFMILSSIITKNINLPLVTSLINGIFEITQGLNELTFLNINPIKKAIIALFIISFSGISIHLQEYSIINDNKLNYRYYFKGRLIAILLSLTLFLIELLFY